MPNGARRVSGNWVIPNEIGNELGNIVGVIQKMENTRRSTYDVIGRQTRQTGLQRDQKWAKGIIGSPARMGEASTFKIAKCDLKARSAP